MNDLKIGDVRYYNKTPVTVKSIRDAGYTVFATIQWFVGDELNEKEVYADHLLTLPVYPEYSDYIEYLEENEMLEGVGSPDHLEEMLLNDAYYILKGKLESYKIPEDDLLFWTYEILHSIEDKFKYYCDCATADGYEMAVHTVKGLNEDVGKRMMQDVLEIAEKRKRK